MPSEEYKPSSGGSPQDVNPYAASNVPEPAGPFRAYIGPPLQRHYQARLAWADRHALLRSVGAVRLTAVVLAVWWIRNLYEHFDVWTRFFVTDGIADLWDLTSLFLGVIFIAQGLLSVYLCWLSWIYAESLRQVAGGATTDMRPWSRLHWKTAWLGALAAILGLGVDLISWIASLVLPAPIEG
jgi:hypothetical protein